MTDDTVLSIWTIYDHPKDFPNTFVARRHESSRAGSQPTGDCIVSPDLERLREHLIELGLGCIPRSPYDDPNIVESWL